MIWIKVIIFTILVPGTVTVLIPFGLLLLENKPLPTSVGLYEIIGLTLMSVGVSIYIWCTWDFVAKGQGTPAPIEPPKKLVLKSLYRISRNPMYVGILSILIGESFLLRSFIFAAYATVVFICFHFFILFYEEPTLRKQFGEEYIRYCKRAPRWLIRWPLRVPSAGHRKS